MNNYLIYTKSGVTIVNADSIQEAITFFSIMSDVEIIAIIKSL